MCTETNSLQFWIEERKLEKFEQILVSCKENLSGNVQCNS